MGGCRARRHYSGSVLSTSWLLGLVWLVEIGLAVAAAGDAVRHRAPTYPAAGKLTKPVWLTILGLSLLFILLACPISAILEQPTLSPTNLLPLAGLIASSVYLVDVRPALALMRGRGGGRQGPYGPW